MKGDMIITYIVITYQISPLPISLYPFPYKATGSSYI